MHHESEDADLIGYLMDDLDENAKAKVQGQLEGDEDMRWRLEQIRQTLAPLAADNQTATPPDGLAVRTIARVAEFCCLDLAHAPAAVARSAPVRSWWRRADLVVAASLLLLALGLGAPALFRLRARPALIECENNMRVLNAALQTFRDRHHVFPSVVAERPRDAAGMVVPILANAGVLPDTNIRCPGSGPGVSCQLNLDALRDLDLIEFDRQAPNLVLSYAYSLGRRDEGGNYYGPGVPEGMPASDFPLLADSPPPDGAPGNSYNHGRRGQWVLFADGHADFLTTRTVGAQNDDIYLNKGNKVAAGLDPCDTVLGPSAARP